MKHLLRILRFSKELRGYYVGISIISIIVSLTALLNPLLSGWAIDEIRKGSTANIRYLVLVALFIFALDVLGTFLNNIGGYLGDQMSAKLNKILSHRYYEHLLELPQQYFDTELTGKIINRLNRSIVQITSFMQMMSNNFLQFIFTTIFSLAVVFYYSWQVALLLFMLYPIYIWLTVKTSNKWQEYQAKKNLHVDIATGRFAEAIGQIKVVKSFIRQKSEYQPATVTILARA
jgi:ATP-binding cassette subfamily B protein